MLVILRQLPDTLSTFESLRHWVYGPPATKINLDLVQHLRNVEDTEAEFLLRTVSQLNNVKTEEQERLCTLKQELQPQTIITTEDGDSFPVRALLDPGCTDSAIDRNFVQREGLETKLLPVPKTSHNADGSTNSGGSITEYVSVRLDVNGHSDLWYLVVTNLSYDVFIGFDWIAYHNPEVNWQTEEIKFSHCPQGCQTEIDLPPIHFHQLFLRGVSMEIQREVNSAKPMKSLDDLPDWLQDFRDVFEPSSFDEIPPIAQDSTMPLILSQTLPLYHLRKSFLSLLRNKKPYGNSSMKI
jgi:Retroviral aspartyl protease